MKKICLWTILVTFMACEAPQQEVARPAAPRELPNEIDATQANREKLAWMNVRSDLIEVLNQSSGMQGDAKYVARGFSVPVQDMRDILAVIGSGQNFYTMMAIRDTTVTVIFQVKDANGVTHYFDFTDPCPISCPD